MVSSKNLEKATEIVSGDNLSITGAEPSNAVFARMLGLKIYDYNVPESLAIQDKIEKSIERDFKAAMNKAKKEEDKRGYPDYEELDETLQDLQERMEERVARLRGEEEEE
jgi:protein-tyrosine phosphatase